MFHSVPKKLAQNKEDAAIFQKHWNFEVSPGEVMYGYSKDGREQVRWAVEQNLSPRGDFHSKSVFTQGKFSHDLQSIPVPLCASQNLFLQVKHLKSNAVTFFEQFISPQISTL